MTQDRTTVLLCSCARSMQVDADAIQAAVPEAAISRVHTTLCRSDTDAYLAALKDGGDQLCKIA